MEEPLYIYKNRLRNTLTIAYWISIVICVFLIIAYSNLIRNSGSIIVLGLIVSVALIPFKRLKTNIYTDGIVFKESGCHPLLSNEFGIAFENIYDYKVMKTSSDLIWVVIKRRNGKTIRRLLSFSESELFEFSKILNEKVMHINS